MKVQDDPLTARRVAGYRVLRSLARDEAAEVLLGFREQAGQATGEQAGEQARELDAPATVALKTMAATPSRWAETVAALEALERARGEHAVRVLDVEATDDTLCVIFERLPNGSLAELLSLRRRLDAGEVVTIVAPLSAAVERMHSAGVAHGAIGARTVLFRADGAPVLIGFGSSSCFPSGAPEVVLEREGGVVADRRAVRELSCLMLGRVQGSRGRAARDLVTELESCPEELVLPLLGMRLFELAAALPVRFEVDADEAPPEAARVIPIAPPVGEGAEAVGRAAGLIERVIPEAWVQRVLDGIDGSPAAPVLRGVARVWRGWSPGRRRVVLGVGVVVVVLSGALAVIPTAPPATADAARPPSRSPLGAAAGSPAAEPDSAEPDSSEATASEKRARSVEGDNPLAAAEVLVGERERCLRSLSLLCLDAVDQSDGGALRADREAIRGAQQGGELPDPLVAAGSVLAPELVQRLGDSALVRLAVAASAGRSGAASDAPGATASPDAEPASLLLVKGEAGWRIRDVIASPTNVSAGSS